MVDLSSYCSGIVQFTGLTFIPYCRWIYFISDMVLCKFHLLYCKVKTPLEFKLKVKLVVGVTVLESLTNTPTSDH
jgi:hypothetical protein